MASCFDPFRPRTHSFDLHLLMHRPKLNKISKLFRSRSESSVKSPSSSPLSGVSPADSPRHSPKPSPGAPHKRRFMRVVRDGDSSGEEYENPHVIRKYSQKYAQTRYGLKKSHSLDDQSHPLPYTVTGHTILKKHSSFEQGPGVVHVVDSPDQSPPSSKHASFKDEVEVIEYDRKEKIQKHCCFTHHEQLIMDEVDVNLRLLSVNNERLDECEECEEEQAKKEQPEMLDGEVFHLDDDESSDSDIVDEQPLPELPHSFEADPHGLSRQLSSSSDSSDCERPTQVKKTRLDKTKVTSSGNNPESDTSSSDKSQTSSGSKAYQEVQVVARSRKMEVEQ